MKLFLNKIKNNYFFRQLYNHLFYLTCLKIIKYKKYFLNLLQNQNQQFSEEQALHKKHILLRMQKIY